jgi:transcriptional regulator with XRE-family HTH domain
MRFGAKLQELRKRKGLTQVALAQKSGRSLGAIRDYEQGKKEPTLRAALQLAAALGVMIGAFADCLEDEPSQVRHMTGPRSRSRRNRS